MRILALAVVLLLVGCTPNVETDVSAEQVIAEYYTSEIVYTIDERTDICYAWANPGYPRAISTAVPCTPEVLALIPDHERKTK